MIAFMEITELLACESLLKWEKWCRNQLNGESEIHSLMEKVEQGKARAQDLEQEIKGLEGDVKGLQTEKELQSGGEVRELAQKADGCSKRLACSITTIKYLRQHFILGELS